MFCPVAAMRLKVLVYHNYEAVSKVKNLTAANPLRVTAESPKALNNNTITSPHFALSLRNLRG